MIYSIKMFIIEKSNNICYSNYLISSDIGSLTDILTCEEDPTVEKKYLLSQTLIFILKESKINWNKMLRNFQIRPNLGTKDIGWF